MNQLLKKVFYTGIVGLTLFEILNVYLIMPMPGSQEITSIGIAYLLYSYCWYFRIFFGLMIITGGFSVLYTGHRWLPVLSLALAFAIIYIFNFRMKADVMFKQPVTVTFKPESENEVNENSIVIAVEHNGTVKGYPVQFISYHHQVRDTVGGQIMMITYCNVCRTGRVYLPVVKGKNEFFRLVGMDHFNAMFEDATTKSWWRQSTGEAVTGPLKGEILTELRSMQLTIKNMFLLYPGAFVMQADKASEMKYDSLRLFEDGIARSKLTRTDTLPWEKKSWVVGIPIGRLSIAYDWNLIKKLRIINGKVGDTPIVLALSGDGRSFAAFERPAETEYFTLSNDTLFSENAAYDFAGRSLTEPTHRLKRIMAYQEFWHSWQTFHPNTQRYK